MNFSPLTALIFIFALPARIHGDVLKMIKVFGKVDGAIQPAQTETSIDDCTDACFSLPDCILAYVNPDLNCYLYNYTSTQELVVLETTNAEGQCVSFKTSMNSDTCPASQDLVNLTVTVGVDTYYWTRTGTGWSLRKCVDDWKRFERADNVVVCMQWFKMPNESTIQGARQFCKDKGYVLSGVGSVEECQYFHSKLVPSLSYGCARFYGFWIDGERNCPMDKPNCTNFIWTDGYTTGNAAFVASNVEFSYTNYEVVENCLAIAINLYAATLNDVSCIPKLYECAVGAVCGYKFN